MPLAVWRDHWVKHFYFCNLLMLTGPLYKLQVYDSVLSSRSLAIALVLAAWIALLCIITGIRDCCRTRRMAGSGAGFPQALEKPFLDAAMGASLLFYP